MKHKFVVVRASSLILATRPIPHLRAGGILQPLIIIKNMDPLIAIGDGLSWGSNVGYVRRMAQAEAACRCGKGERDGDFLVHEAHAARLSRYDAREKKNGSLHLAPVWSVVPKRRDISSYFFFSVPLSGKPFSNRSSRSVSFETGTLLS